MFNRSSFMAITLLMVSSVSAKVVMIESVDQYNELNEGTLITMFTGEGCPPCKQIKPHYIAFSEEFADVTFCMIDIGVEELREIDPSIQGIPTFVFTHEGTELDRVIGGRRKVKLKQFIEKNRAAVLGKEYTVEAAKILTADEYYTIGLNAGRRMVEESHKKDVPVSVLFGMARPDESLMPLFEACMKTDSSDELFELLKSYARGMKESLITYKKHQKLQDAFIKNQLSYVKYILGAPNYADVMRWTMALSEKAQAKLQEYTLLAMAEISSDELSSS